MLLSALTKDKGTKKYRQEQCFFSNTLVYMHVLTTAIGQ